MRILEGILVLVLLSGASAEGSSQNLDWSEMPRPPAGGIFKAQSCEGINNTFRCARAIEAVALRESMGVVERTDSGLVLNVGNRTAVVADEPEAEWPSYFSFIGVLPELGFYVLHEQHPEGSEIRLIQNRSGWSKRIDALPVVSPAGDRVAVASDDYYGRNLIALYRVAGDTLALEWEIEPEDWAASAAFWTAPDQVGVLRRYVLACEFPQRIPWYQEHSDTVQVVIEKGSWNLEAGGTESVPDSIAGLASKCYLAPPF